MTVNIEYETEVPLFEGWEELIRRVVSAALDSEGCPYEAEVNIVVTNNESIREINREYRKIDSPTDVLSFPMLEYEEPGDFSALEQEEEYNAEYFNPDTGELLLGDVMISAERVIAQAKEYGHSRERELGFLTAHSMLHLFGYDHMEEKEREVMEAKQRALLDSLQITR